MLRRNGVYGLLVTCGFVSYVPNFSIFLLFFPFALIESLQ